MSLQALPFELYTHILSFSSPEERGNIRLSCKNFYRISLNNYYRCIFSLSHAKPQEFSFEKPDNCINASYMIDSLGKEKIVSAFYNSQLNPNRISIFSTKNLAIKNYDAKFKCSGRFIASSCGEGVFLLKNFDVNRETSFIKIDAFLHLKSFNGDQTKNYLVHKMNKGMLISFEDSYSTKTFSCHDSATNAINNYTFIASLFDLKKGSARLVNDEIIFFHKSQSSRSDEKIKYGCGSFQDPEPLIEVNALKSTKRDNPKPQWDSEFFSGKLSHRMSTLKVPTNTFDSSPLNFTVLIDQTEALLCIFKDNKIDNWHFLDLTGPSLIASVAHDVLVKNPKFENEILRFGLYEKHLILYTRHFNDVSLRSTLELTKFSADRGLEVNHTFLCPSHLKVSQIGKKYISIAKENFDNFKENAAATYSLEIYDLKSFILRASCNVGKYRPLTIDFSNDSLTAVLENEKIVHFKRA